MIYLLGGGQRYGITVREVEPDEPVKKLVAVGVSRVTLIDAVAVTFFDGLPGSASRAL